MSTTKHPTEPWKRTHDERPELGGAFFTLRHSNGCPLAIVLDPDQGTSVDGDVAAAEEAIADRILACVNACAPIEDPAAALEVARIALRAIALEAAQAVEMRRPMSIGNINERAADALRALGG